ncbi:anaphase-promoting complex, subunit 10-domain-containing protein [Gongronella butleri]|nr:anaphase-promoting complex, subunit 10-domain-containing protein [Gongronella butleri]
MYTDILLRLDAPAFPSNLTASSINDPTEIADPIDTLNGTADPPSPHVNMFTEDAPERPDDDGDEEDDDDAAEGAVEEEDESEGQNVDDSERENTAITVYKSDHPDHQQKLKNGREVTELEATWAVSTFRPDWGVEKMRDNNPLTYWQSDCSNPKAPHTIDLFFTQATVIQQVSIFIDYYQDESYCPKHITIRGGNTYRDLCDIVEVECPEMVGWKNMDLSEILDEPVRVFQLQISINSTHLNGRDTHVRQLKVYSTPSPRFQLPDKANAAADGRLPLTMSMKGLR